MRETHILTNAVPAQRNVGERAAHRAVRFRSITWPPAAQDFMSVFPDEDACLEFVKELRWPKGTTRCGRCGVARKHHRVRGRKAYACDRCGTHIYPLRGTVFARSATPLHTWFYAICLLAVTGHYITARQIQRETGVTYKTAWRMLGRLRASIAQCDMPAQPVERCPAGDTHQSRNVPCLEGILFILKFFPAYLRMCRDA